MPNDLNLSKYRFDQRLKICKSTLLLLPSDYNALQHGDLS